MGEGFQSLQSSQTFFSFLFECEKAHNKNTNGSKYQEYQEQSIQKMTDDISSFGHQEIEVE